MEDGRELQDRRAGPDRREVRGLPAGHELGAGRCRGSTRATARASGSCRSSTPARRSTSTSSNDILRLPYRQRFAILLNEFGTGLAGRGEDLNEVIHRANPALRETDKVLKILADQNRTLARLARDSDQALGAARARAASRSPTSSSRRTRPAEASAERRGDLAREHPPAARLPARAAAADGGPRGLHRPGHAAAHRPERRRARRSGRLIKAQGTLADASRETPSRASATRSSAAARR